ncbi:MAG TPA: chain length determinant protein EpsF [Burkholderiales bacterium]|nr:chain length determinant protein EpsF [Burkholderiales bacterium]
MLDRIQILPALQARWRSALIVWVGIVVAVAALTLAMPARYEATAALVIEMNAADPMRKGEVFRPSGSVSSYLATQVDVIKSEAVALAALRRLELHKDPSLQERWREETQGRGDFESWLATGLLNGLAVTPSRESNLVTVSFTSQDPQFAAAIVNAFVQSYMDTTLQMRAGPARQFSTFFQERATSLRQRLDEAKARLTAYEQKHGLIVSDAPNEHDVDNARLTELTSQLVKLQDEATDAANRRRQAAAGADRMREVRSDPEVMDLTKELAARESELAKLKSQFGDRHPAVLEVQQAITQLRASLSTARQRAAATFDVPVTSNEARIAEVRKAIEQQRAVVMQRRSQRNAAAGLLRDVENAQKAYDAVLQRASETALEAQNTTQPDVSVVKAPTPPAKASSIYLLINVFVAGFLAPLFAVLYAVFREARDRRVRTIGDVTGLLQQPLLLMLPDGERQTGRRSLEAQRRLVSAQRRLFAPR